MGGYTIVPQLIVDALAPGLSQDPNMGRVMAEHLCRQDSIGSVLQKMQAGETLEVIDIVQLPPLLPGHTWDAIADKIKLTGNPTAPAAPAEGGN